VCVLCACMCVLCVRDMYIQRCRHVPGHTHIHVRIQMLMYVEAWNIMAFNLDVPPSEVDLVITTVDLIFGHIRPAFSENVKPKNNVQCSILCGVSILYKVVPASISKFV